MSENENPAEAGRRKATGKLEEMTIEEVGEFRAEVAVFPLGSTEPHGPHLPYGTDTIIAEGGAGTAVREANARGARVMELPCLPIGNNVNFKAYPLACRMRVETLEAVLCDMADFLVEEGIRKLVFLNAHGGNVPALQAALRRIHDLHEGELFACGCSISAFRKPGSPEIFNDHSPHAGDYETSLVLHLAPELVRTERMESTAMMSPELAGLRNPAIQWVKPWHEFMPSSCGGRPDLATQEKGRQFLEECAKGFADFLVELSSAPWHPRFPYSNASE
jgi:creatinine amidohydrolase